VIYNNKFYNHENQDTILQDTPKLLAEYIAENYSPESVIDVGCGTGIYLQELAKFKINVFGIDGSPAAFKNFRLDHKLFKLSDIAKPMKVDKKYSAALCFEVAEHIPNRSSNQLVENLAPLADLIFFSAAPKGQGGIGHINEQDSDFWIALFKQAGFNYQDEATKKLKKFLSDNRAIFWLSDNIMIFKKNK
jgi:2-polyprenyl-3-methyl-5-hydroxy-6-metoxy-1,4-benzoquinol methylase